MPTVFRFGSFRGVIYPNDHRPPDVHVIGNGHEDVFELRCPNGPVELRENYGFARSDLAAIVVTLNGHLEILCAAWGKIHGL
jgi:hypothetical protein